MPLQRSVQQRSAAATPTSGGRSMWEVGPVVGAAPSARPCAAVAACKCGGSRAAPCVALRVQTRRVRRWGQAALGRQRLVHSSHLLWTIVVKAQIPKGIAVTCEGVGSERRESSYPEGR